MANNFTFSDDGWEHYLYWQSQDKKTLSKINRLLKSIARDGFLKGEGKPEKLKNSETYSRRIDEKNRLTYELDELNNIHILSCKGHYDDK